MAEKTRPSHVELVRRHSATRPWGYHVRASNGKITEPSQGYTSRAHARRAALRAAERLMVEMTEPDARSKASDACGEGLGASRARR